MNCNCCGIPFIGFTRPDCDLCSFLIESNRIEGIFGRPSKDSIFKSRAFLKLSEINVEDLCYMANTFEPGVSLRTQPGMDVRVGRHIAPRGGPEIILDLQHLLEALDSPYESHREFERLHPFTDSNGRTGRLYWLWRMKGLDTSLGFLHTWYYQSLEDQ